MAASATTTSREVGTVLGVAILGSLFNNQLIENLTQRLLELEIPQEFHDLIIDQVLTGQSSQSAAEAEAMYGPIVGKAVAAAFDAVHTCQQLAVGGRSCHPGIGGYRLGDFSRERLSAV